MKLPNFVNSSADSSSKNVHDFSNKVVQKLKLSKNVLLNKYSSMEKKFRKIRMIFDIENSLRKSDLDTF